MPPIDDPRPFADVLRDWMARHDIASRYACAQRLGLTHHSTIGKWLDGHPPSRERSERALMTLIDEGRG